MEMKMKNKGKLIANNPKARHDYFLDQYIEAGISLAGTEVKSLRSGKCSIKEAWIRIQNGELWIYQMNIPPYEMGNIMNRDPIRPRKLLVHKSEIRKLGQLIKEKGVTIVPVEVYFKGEHVKVEIAVARGKKLYDKRRDIAKKDQEREAARDLKIRNGVLR
jgi:SsrA-binding protein